VGKADKFLEENPVALEAKKKEIEVGDTVKYAVKWLRSVGEISGPLPRAKGKVTKLVPLGKNKVATIDWGRDDIPKQVLSANLALADDPESASY
jgi:hypothetical protein